MSISGSTIKAAIYFNTVSYIFFGHHWYSLKGAVTAWHQQSGMETATHFMSSHCHLLFHLWAELLRFSVLFFSLWTGKQGFCMCLALHFCRILIFLLLIDCSFTAECVPDVIALKWKSTSVGLECFPSKYQLPLHFPWKFFLLSVAFPNDSGNPGFFPLFLQVTCNCFTISNGEMQDVGVGLYPRYCGHCFIHSQNLC